MTSRVRDEDEARATTLKRSEQQMLRWLVWTLPPAPGDAESLGFWGEWSNSTDNVKNQSQGMGVAHGNEHPAT